MRGKAPHFSKHRICNGITPAHAGKRQLRIYAGSFPRDHPRTCGEKAVKADEDNIPLGSPPHMRGKGTTVGICSSAPGITPAHAGKSGLGKLR